MMNEIKKEALPKLRTLLQKLLDETKERMSSCRGNSLDSRLTWFALSCAYRFQGASA